MNDNGDLVFLG